MEGNCRNKAPGDGPGLLYSFPKNPGRGGMREGLRFLWMWEPGQRNRPPTHCEGGGVPSCASSSPSRSSAITWRYTPPRCRHSDTVITNSILSGSLHKMRRGFGVLLLFVAPVPHCSLNPRPFRGRMWVIKSISTQSGAAFGRLFFFSVADRPPTGPLRLSEV